MLCTKLVLLMILVILSVKPIFKNFKCIIIMVLYSGIFVYKYLFYDYVKIIIDYTFMPLNLNVGLRRLRTHEQNLVNKGQVRRNFSRLRRVI